MMFGFTPARGTNVRFASASEALPYISESRKEVWALLYLWWLHRNPYRVGQEEKPCLVVGVPAHADRCEFPRPPMIRVR